MVTTQEAADIIGTSHDTVSRMAADGRLTPAVRLPTATLYLRADVERMAEARRIVKGTPTTTQEVTP
jgi:excisionase family DNA binding protein